MMDAKAVATRLGVCVRYAYALMRQMPHHAFGRAIRVEEADLTAWLEARKIAPCASIAAPGRRSGKSIGAASDVALDLLTKRRPKTGSKSYSEERQTRRIARRTKPLR